MLSALCMCEIGAVVLVNSQAKTTFEGSDVVFEKVRVLVEIDCFESQATKTFTTVCIRR